MSKIQTKNLSFGYANAPLLVDLNLHIGSSEFYSIAGPNGVGKSTLLALLMGFLKPQSGIIFLNDKKLSDCSIKQIAQSMAYVPQQIIQPFSYSVDEIVMMARFFRKGRLYFEKDEDIHAVQEALECTDTAHLANRSIAHLSGGERQRVYIARALVQDTPILLLDEPTSHLDWKHQVQIYDLLRQLQMGKGKTIVTVSHDLNLAARYCDSIVLLGSEGKVYQGKTDEILEGSRIKDIFGVDTLDICHENRTWFFPNGKRMR